MLLTYLLEHNRYCNILGIAVILSIAWLFSHKRSAINYRIISVGLALQFLIGFCVLKTTLGRGLVAAIAAGVGNLYLAAGEGTSFLFGNLANPAGSWGFIFAIKVLPIIVFFGAFMALLFHFFIIQRLVGAVNLVLRPLLGTSGPETLCAIANSFLGQTEAPLLVRHYLKHMTRSELFAVMVSGMATISGAILVVFVAMGVPVQHLLASSVMSIPGSLIMAKILLPEENKTEQAADSQTHVYNKRETNNMFDAIAVGTSDGLQLALNVGAMLIVFLALLGLLNSCLAGVSHLLNQLISYFYVPGAVVDSASSVGVAESSSVFFPAKVVPLLSLERIVGFICLPFGYLLGFTGDYAWKAGELIGTKVAVNELIAYSNLVAMQLPERMQDIMTYALCGFSNIACIGIQVGGIGVLVPEKRAWISQLGLYAVLAGALTNILSALIISLLI